MPTKSASTRLKNTQGHTCLVARISKRSKAYVAEAAELRGISVSDYVCTVAVGQARREVCLARQGILSLTPDEQLAFWNALKACPKLSKAQRWLGKIMRGDS